MKKVLQVTIDEDLLKRIKEMAAEQNRNVSNLVETLLYAAVKEGDKK